MHKLATNDPKTMEYEIIGADGSIIWGELALDDYLSDYITDDNRIYICDLSVADRCFEILIYVEGQKEKVFTVLRFDYKEKNMYQKRCMI